ncbi:sel1 repeat family protein [Avibacterium paragallinarum]|uniref:tetratricopeptide repeat protein n=1 Tax=Avibacterium paragallinarum TaxID=728 RepID=UPI002EDB23F3
MKKILLPVFLLVSNFSFAAPINDNTEFYCQTNKGKQISVEFNGVAFEYRFGKNLNKPEIFLSRKPSEVNITRELYAYSGEDRISFSNGAYQYIVVSGDSTKGGTYGGIEVLKKQKEIANIACKEDTIFVNTQGKIRKIIESSKTKPNNSTSITELKSLANQGNADAQARLGFMYLQGNGVKQNLNTAYDLFQKAAAKENGIALMGLSMMYQKGIGVPYNKTIALKFAERACLQKIPEACGVVRVMNYGL